MNNRTDINTVIFRDAAPVDAGRISELFLGHIRGHHEYISHGEMQMGIAPDPDSIASDTELKWRGYIDRRIGDREGNVILALAAGEIIGFAVVQLGEDGGKRFGVLDDILVHSAHRGRGIGKSLLREVLGWLGDRGISYCNLESGRHNHFAHEFFQRQGFGLVSLTFYKVINNTPEFDFGEEKTK